MADTYGKTAFLIGRLTMYKDGSIRPRVAQEGPDRTGINIVVSTLEQFDILLPGNKWKPNTRRVGFHPASGQLPIWWGESHMTALRAWVADKRWVVEDAAHESTHGQRIDTPEKVTPSKPMEIKSDG